jgi:dTMP kinase
MVLITVEGLDGAGTTTLVEELSNNYDNFVATTEPSDGTYGQLVRENLSKETDPLVDFFLFMADRRDHIENKIKPLEEESKTVISDRYADSTRAYQPTALCGEGKPFDSLWEAKLFIEKVMGCWEYGPDLTLYLQISVDTAIERNSGDEKYENRAFLESVKANYDAIAESKDRVVTIDAEQSIEAVTEDAISVIDRKI